MEFMKNEVVNCSKIAERIKELRVSKGLSREKLSNELRNQYGISISTDCLQNYEVVNKNQCRYGKLKGMKIEYLICFADYFGVSTDFILGLTDVRSQKTNIKSINQATGLDETAIKYLMTTKTFSKSTVSDSKFTAEDALAFYSHLISDVRVLETVAFAIDRLASIQNRGLTESEKVVFKDSDEAISFYQYKIQKTLDSFVKGLSKLYKKENGSMDQEGSGKGHGG